MSHNTVGPQIAPSWLSLAELPAGRSGAMAKERQLQKKRPQVSFDALISYMIEGRDGGVGKVKDILFGVRPWGICFIVVDTGSWLVSRKVLLSPQSFKIIDTQKHQIITELTKKQIAESPSIEEHTPITRTISTNVSNYYQWQPNWIPGELPLGVLIPPTTPPQSAAIPNAESDGDEFSLYSAKDVMGFDVRDINDDKVGALKGLVLDISNWCLTYVLISHGMLTGNKSVVLPIGLVKNIDPLQKSINIKTSYKNLHRAPIFAKFSELRPPQEKAVKSFFTELA